MDAKNKEKVFEELRNYHLKEFPVVAANIELNDLRSEFGELEDKIIGMLLSLVNGKAEFVDATDELDAFKTKLDKYSPENGENESKDVFASKISWLRNILVLAKESNFKLRVKRFGIRVAKT